MNWPQLKNFSPNENWGNPEKMDHRLLKLLDVYRTVVDEQIFVSCGTQGQHVQNSLHYQGKAVDILFPNQHRSLFDCFLIAERFNFGGIGIYPDWVYNGKKIGGLHLDIRIVDYAARWIGVKEFETTLYLSLNKDHLQTYKII